MSRVFAYCRVSTTEQSTENQVQEIAAAGFVVEPRRLVAETVSGSSAIAQRPGFMKLIERMESGDVLVVTRLDRLGRNAMDVQSTVARLEAAGVRVYCLALGGTDLTSSAGKMTMSVIAAVAEFEKNLLVERTMAGIERARSQGKVPGRRPALTQEQRADARARIAAGSSISQVAKAMQTSRMTIQRARDEGRS